MNKQCSRLVLKTNTLTIGGNNVNDDFSKYNFNNINLRSLIGDMYDKYDLFNLSLKSIASGKGFGTISGQVFGSSLDDLAVSIYMSGLPFINQTYDVNSDNGIYSNTNEVLLTNFIFKRDDSATLNYLNENYITFSKNQQMVNLYIRYEKISELVIPDSEATFPDVVYIFEIYGVDEPKSINQIMNQRIV